MAGVAYLDTSALVKFIVAEAESAALERDAANREGLVCSRLGATEASRALHRIVSRRVLQQLEELKASVVFIDLTTPILEDAGNLKPADLRTLDAIHIATALSLNVPGLEFITYDDRMARAAKAHGLRVVRPSGRV